MVSPVMWCWRCCQGVIALALAAASATTMAQQRRDSGPPLFSNSGSEMVQDAELRQQKRMRWLKEANGALPVDSDAGAPAEQVRMHGMSREERRRLRQDILEAGYTAYSPGIQSPGMPSLNGRGPERGR